MNKKICLRCGKETEWTFFDFMCWKCFQILERNKVEAKDQNPYPWGRSTWVALKRRMEAKQSD